MEVGEKGGGGGEAAEEGEEGGAQGGEGGGWVPQKAVGEQQGAKEFGAKARGCRQGGIGGRGVGGGKPPQEEGERLVGAGVAAFRFGSAQEGEEAALDVGVEDIVDGARARGEGLQGYVARLDADGRGEVAVADFQGDTGGGSATLAYDTAHNTAEWAVDYSHGVGCSEVDFAGGVDGEVVGFGGGDAPEGFYGLVAERDVAVSALGRCLRGAVDHGVDLGARGAEGAQLGAGGAQKGIVEQQGRLYAARTAALGAVEPADARGEELGRLLFRAHSGDGAAERLGGGAPVVGFTYGN